MSGCFGLNESHCHVRYPADRLIENRQRLDVFGLNKLGLLLEGTNVRLALGVGNGEGSLATSSSAIFVNGIRVPLTYDEPHLGGLRAWFLCPKCSRRCRHVYFPEILCRRCCELDWASRHLHRSLPGLHRVMRLRRMAGLDPHPFSPIPKRQPRFKRYARLVARIMIEERHLVQVLGHVNRDLDRRARLRGILPKLQHVAAKR